MKNKFFEFSEPYFALLGAPNSATAIDIYKKQVSGVDTDDQDIVFKQVTYFYTLSKVKEEILDNASSYDSMLKTADKIAKNELNKSAIFLINYNLI